MISFCQTASFSWIMSELFHFFTRVTEIQLPMRDGETSADSSRFHTVSRFF